MKLIDRYLAGWFFRVFALTATTFLALFMVVTVFERLGMLMKYNASLANSLLFLGGMIPEMLAEILPMASLLSALVALTILSRNGETTALRTSGLSLVRIARPFALCGLVLCALSFMLQEYVVPGSASFSRQVRYLRIRGFKSMDLVENTNTWLRYGPYMIHVDQALLEEGALAGVEVFELGPGGVKSHVRAPRAVWTNGAWELKDATVLQYPENAPWTTRAEPSFKAAIAPAPTELVVEDKGPEQMSLGEMSARIRSARLQGLATGRMEVDLWAKTAKPFACLIMPVLSVPFALRTSRKGGLWSGVAVGVGVGLSYYIVMMFSIALGQAGALPSWLAAWAGNALALVAGVVLFRRAERGL